jgi:hypothetical protein
MVKKMDNICCVDSVVRIVLAKESRTATSFPICIWGIDMNMEEQAAISRAVRIGREFLRNNKGICGVIELRHSKLWTLYNADNLGALALFKAILNDKDNKLSRRSFYVAMKEITQILEDKNSDYFVSHTDKRISMDQGFPHEEITRTRYVRKDLFQLVPKNQ